MSYFIILAALYIIGMGVLIYGWGKWTQLAVEDFTPALSIIIPMRNEAKNLPLLFRDLAQLDYPFEQVSLMIIDDHSEDNSLELAHQLARNLPFSYSILQNDDQQQGKKAALSKAIQMATSAIILTTDADCRLPKQWLRKMVMPFSQSRILFVSGPVVMHTDGFFAKLLHQEFLSLIGVGAAALGLGQAGMANGANMAFRKDTFLKLNPYQDNAHIPSGDDEFLLEKINRTYAHSTYFVNDPEAVVRTDAPASGAIWVHQRRRWAGKWKHGKNVFKWVLPAAVALFHLSLILMTILWLIGLLTFELWFTVMMMRATIEFIFLKEIHQSLNQSFSFSSFLVWQIIYPLYAVMFALLANFGRYNWKGRTYRL
jgi:poly-beta-1,6-N-acetyl-D-glucosamine synthase